MASVPWAGRTRELRKCLFIQNCIQKWLNSSHFWNCWRNLADKGARSVEKDVQEEARRNYRTHQERGNLCRTTLNVLCAWWGWMREGRRERRKILPGSKFPLGTCFKEARKREGGTAVWLFSRLKDVF